MFSQLTQTLRSWRGTQSSAPPSKRLTERLVTYWQGLKGYRAFPSEAEIDPEALGDAWDGCFLVRVRDQGEEVFRYTYLGRSLIDAYGNDITGQEVCERLVNPGSPLLYRHFSDVITSRRPVIEEGEFVNMRSQVVKYRCCLLPLGDGPDHVDFILGGMRWRFY